MRGIESPRRTLVRPSWLEPLSGPLEEAAWILFVSGLPSQFVGPRFCLDSELALMRIEGAPVLRFGTSGLAGALGVEVNTGQVVEIVQPPDPHRIFVNSSLAAFVSTLDAVVARFPYYNSDDDPNECEAAGDDLIRIIRRIDPAAARPDRFWSTFVDDVRIGDLATEAVWEAIRGWNP